MVEITDMRGVVFMSLKNFFGHLSVVTRHRTAVLINCIKCGIPLRGLLHDLSKFSPTEFFESVKYFDGHRSPIGVCRRATGMSHAWLHHKGRNKHHLEYWLDPECQVTPAMPYKYAVECVCDKLAATHTYLGKDYTTDKPQWHWERYGCKVNGNPKTMAFLTAVFEDVKIHGDAYVLSKKYMKEKYGQFHNNI